MSINLEHLIQIGATAELVLDHGWSPADIDFERGEFDAVGVGPSDQVLLVMEAKARVSGPDSLEQLAMGWLSMAMDAGLDLNNYNGRKYREPQRLCRSGGVVAWLFAEGARWTLTAELNHGSVRLTPASDPTPELCREPWLIEETMMHEALPYDARHHRQGTAAAAGHCSWHGTTCAETPVISLQDSHGWWQSGCQRALDELVGRGEISPPRLTS